MRDINHKQVKINIDGKPIEVDYGIKDIILALNKKGYKTAWSCQGYKDIIRFYVAFQQVYPEIINKLPKNILWSAKNPFSSDSWAFAIYAKRSFKEKDFRKVLKWINTLLNV